GAGETLTMRSGANGSREGGKKLEPTTSLNSRSAVFAAAAIAVSTSRSTAEVRTIGPTPGMRDPLIATPSIQVTTSTATTLRAAPPPASTGRAGCQVIVSRARPPTYCRIAWPNDAQTSTTNTASMDTSSD